MIPWEVEFASGIGMMIIGGLGLAAIILWSVFGIPDRLTYWLYELLDEAITDAELEAALIEPTYLSDALWLERGFWRDR